MDGRKRGREGRGSSFGSSGVEEGSNRGNIKDEEMDGLRCVHFASTVKASPVLEGEGVVGHWGVTRSSATNGRTQKED